MPPASRTARSGSRARRLALALLALAAGVVPAAAQSLVTSAATVRLRAEPTTSSSIVAELPFGTELTAIESASGDWRQVRTADGRTGWVAATLVRSFTSDDRLDVFESIVEARLARAGDGTPSWIQVVDFIERVEAEVEERELAARWAYLRLRALEKAARSIYVIYRKELSPQPFQDWVDANEPLVRYFELGGYFGLDLPAVIDVHDRHGGTRAADDIMWLAAGVGVGGECEGWVPCYVNVMLMLDGEYLRRYPSGRHAAASVARIRDSASRLRGDSYMMPASDCPELIDSIGRLRALVAATATPATADALAALDQVRERCGESAPRPGHAQIH